MSTVDRRRLAVVIPAYRRADLLTQLLCSLPTDRVSRVYVSIDGPAPGAEADVQGSREAAAAFAAQSSFPVFVHALPANVGAAANVLGAVTWMLRHEERGAVLEDDCHPIPEFFDFVQAALDRYADSPDVWLACGTQVAPAELIPGTHVLSQYPLIWGWATSRDKWAAVLTALELSLRSPHRGLLRLALAGPAERYWRAGHRRAAEGRVDAWDLPLVYAMRQSGALAVLPRTPLVSNVGDDARATHTAHEQRWTRLRPEAVGTPLVEAPRSSALEVTRWLERHLYGISPRHLISTSGRWLLDRRSQAQRAPLRQRLAQTAALWHAAPGPTPE